MFLLPVILIAISLSLDSVSVSVASGLKIKQPKIQQALKIALFFGAFQAIMPIIGWFIGANIDSAIVKYDHWIAFALLSLIGVKMVYESFDHTEEKERTNLLNNRTLIALSIATSIDALIIGVTLGLINVPLLFSAFIIGIVTFVFCFFGFLLGKKLGSFFESRVEIIGGIALIALGIKILVEHL